MNPKTKEFIDSVLRLSPKTAVFDCDGTLWAPDAGEGFLSWELQRGLLPDQAARSIRARYAEYKEGKVEEDVMCGEMVTIHAGLSEKQIEEATETYFSTAVEPGIFPEMRQLVKDLAQEGCEVWAVSSSNQWVINAGMRRFGIPPDHVLAVAVEIDQGRITDRLLRIPSGKGKADALRATVDGQVDAAFGNTRWDTEMLELARHPFAINPSTDFEQLARKREWPIYFPDSTVISR